jgi:tRNA nucleotidyltransferase/poly(A) polymerase
MKLTNYNIYSVGGCVRDELLGIKSNDYDFCFVIKQDKNEKLSVEEGFELMKDWLKSEGFQIFLETPTMVTIRAKFPNEWKYLNKKEYSFFYQGKTADFVLARKELSYDTDSRKPVVTIGNLEDDLIRRDFTINAMARDLDGNLIDLFNGQQDLQERILRTPKEAKLTILEDPLRFLRALRFCITRDLKIHNDIIDAMCNETIQDKFVNVVSLDRIREELTKMFKHSTLRTLKLLGKIEEKIPEFYGIVFKDNLWLKPTNEKKI